MSPRIGTVAVVLTLSLSAVAAGQDDGAGSLAPVKNSILLGDTVFVTDRQGRETRGTVRRLSSTSMVVENGIDEREILSTEIGRIEKEGDPVWNGALIGFAASAPYWLIGSAFICADTHGGAGCFVGSSLALGAPFAGVGAFLDWLHRGRTRVYSTENRSASGHGNSFVEFWRTGQTAGPVNSFAQLWTRMSTGDTVHVIETSGRETTGIFQKVSDSSIALLVNGQLREISEADVRQVARQGDSIGNGALIGATVGAALGIQAAACDKSRYGSNGCSGGRGGTAILGIFGATIYGAVGAGIDALIRGRTTVYRSGHQGSSPTVAISPLISPGRKGFAASFTF